MSRKYEELDSLITLRWDQPDAKILTGVTDGSIAQELYIYYTEMTTVVATVGEFNNAPACFTMGRITPEQALADYLEDCHEAATILDRWSAREG